MRKRWFATAAAVLALTSCGGKSADSGEAEAPKSPTSPSTSAPATPSPTPSQTPSKAPEVSEETTCNLLFSGSGKNPLEVIVDFINRPSNSQAQADQMADAIDSLRQIAASASAHLSAQLIAEADEAQRILDDAIAGIGGTFDTTALKAAGYEIANTCQDAL